MEIRAKIDAIEKIIKAIKDSENFRDVVLDAADLFPEKSFEVNGIKFTKAESARYDYTGDDVWTHLKDKEVQAAKLRKEREGVLKALKQPTTIDGIRSLPPTKQSTTGVRVTF